MPRLYVMSIIKNLIFGRRIAPTKYQKCKLGQTPKMGVSTWRMRLILLIVFFTTSNIHAWGLRGHRVTAHIAEKHLNEKARAAVEALLSGESLARVANEADHLRSDSRFQCAAAFHYASVDDGDTYKSSAKSPKGDIVRALIYFENTLRSKDSSQTKKQMALKWLVHLIGDLHQPLHVGRSADRGGNSTDVVWFGKKTNFHKVWDSEIINDQELSYTEFADFLDKGTAQQAASLQNGSYADWADEAPVVRADIYTCHGKDGCCRNKAQKCRDDTTGFGGESDFIANLKYAYVEKQRPLLERQLYRGGVRLAGVLNAIFTGAASPTEKLATDLLKDQKQPDTSVSECFDKAMDKR